MKDSGVRRIQNAFGYSIQGLKAAYTHEPAFRQIVWLQGTIAFMLFWLDFALPVHIMLLALSGLSVVVELFNSAIEAVVDRIGMEQHQLSGRAKDFGSAAQFVMLGTQMLAWIIVLWHRFAF